MQIFTANLQEDAHNHAANENGEQEDDVESSKFIECIFGILKRASTSSYSPPQEGDKGECAMYTSSFNQVAFKYDKHGKSSHNIWRKFTCSFCGLNNHIVSRCWKNIARHRCYAKLLITNKTHSLNVVL